MRERKQGRIMNIASVAAFQACPNFAVYGATKSYVLMFSEALAAEEKKNGIKVLAVCPGATATPFHDVAGNEGTFLTKIMDSPETVAKTAIRAMKCACSSSVVTGVMNKPLPLINRLMPRQCMTWIAGNLAAR
nr:SDR family NAD(P)-dependent oxidoreductase [Gammaproteobacteria bacterium]